MTKTKEVFICHAIKDAQFAHRLADDLRQLGVRVWIAPESIHPGEGWVRAIERGLAESTHIVIVLTPAALESKWVEKETDVAIARERKGRIQVIPLNVEPCEVPPLLSSYQMVSFRRDYNAALSQLADILDVRITPSEPMRPTRQVSPLYKNAIEPKEFILAFGLSFVSVLIIVLIFFRLFRCVLQYRMTEAIVALVGGLVGVAVVLLIDIVPPPVQKLLRCICVGIASALLVCVLVVQFLPPPPLSDCRSILPPTIVTSHFTSTSTSTPTLAVTERLTPTPKPDTVVNRDVLNLRSGPGTDYDILGVLKRGDFLKVTGKDLTGEWLRVIALDGQEGWVACSLLQINADMAGVPVAQVPPAPTPMQTPTPIATPTPTLLPPPILLEPENGAAFIGGPVTFKWQWDRPRAQSEYFSVWVFKEGENEPCHHGRVQDLEYSGYLSYCSGGKHYWGVALVRQLCRDCPEEEKWQNLSEPSVKRWIYYTLGEEPWTWPTPGG